MASARKLYECHTPDCTLGVNGQPGLFTGGASRDYITLITGNHEPSPSEYGPGICPNCTKRGREVKD